MLNVFLITSAIHIAQLEVAQSQPLYNAAKVNLKAPKVWYSLTVVES